MSIQKNKSSERLLSKPNYLPSYFSKLKSIFFEINKNILTDRSFHLPMGSVLELYYPDRCLSSDIKSRPPFRCNNDQSINEILASIEHCSMDYKIFRISEHHNVSKESILYLKTYQSCRGSCLFFVLHTKSQHPALLRLFNALKAEYSLLAGGWVIEYDLEAKDSIDLLKSFFVEMSPYVNYIYDEAKKCEWTSYST